MSGSSQEHPLTVSRLTLEIKGLLEGRFSKIFIEGEISGLKRYPSGHVYFTLKDEGAQISAVMFKSYFDRCPVRDSLKDGAKVLLFATATVYPQRGNYQLSVFAAKLVGAGDLMQRYLELKDRLQNEGLFDSSRKRPLPFLPRRIGIVTSPAGAVIHDMCRVMTRRMPNVEIRLFPAKVQGADAPASLIAGVKYFINSSSADFKPDVIIVARGGGSFEDLFCFNDEGLVRAIAASPVPVISAVGHETDYTLCDFVADVRAGTPSIAAEIAVPEKKELLKRLTAALSSVTSSLRGKYENQSQRVDHLSDRLAYSLRERVDSCARKLQRSSSSLALQLESMRSRCAVHIKTISACSGSLSASLNLAVERMRARLDRSAAKLSVLSPYSVLDRGYSLTTDSAGAIIKSADAVSAGDEIVTRFKTGEIRSVVRSQGLGDRSQG